MEPLSNKKILLGLTGSISIYKSAYLLRSLTALGAEVQVVMTKTALQFMTPAIFSVFSGRPVETMLFGDDGRMAHIEHAKVAELFLVAPATANIIGKAATGIADDLLSTILISGLEKTIMAPAMDLDMWASRATVMNVTRLAGFGVSFAGPESGLLASGLEGSGRMASLPHIIDEVRRFFLPADFKTSLKGKTVLVTSGPTREPVDSVRYLTNRSSGKMGHAVASAARDRGADVVLVTGPVAVAAPAGVELIEVGSAAEMKVAVEKQFAAASIVIKAAAVSDFRPKKVADHKIKKSVGCTIELELTEDILCAIGHSDERKDKIIVGFAAETEQVSSNARKKLKEKNLDMIVVNDLLKDGAGFDTDTNIVTMIEKSGKETKLPIMTKYDVANRIFDTILNI